MDSNNYWRLMFDKTEDEVLKDHLCAIEEKQKSCLQEAYEKAHEIRKFEIELYWKRAIYFWGFEAALIVAFGKIFLEVNEIPGKYIFLALINLFAIFFSYAWILVSKGSKQWQENWEKHIDVLEEHISGNLYKTILFKKSSKYNFFSVSRINEFICVMITIAWCLVLVINCSLWFDLQLNLNSNRYQWLAYAMPFIVLVAAKIVGWWLSFRFRSGFVKCAETKLDGIKMYYIMRRHKDY